MDRFLHYDSSQYVRNSGTRESIGNGRLLKYPLKPTRLLIGKPTCDLFGHRPKSLMRKKKVTLLFVVVLYPVGNTGVGLHFLP